MAGSNQISFIQPTDPNSYASAIQLQRQQQIADALLQQSQTPLSADLPQNLRIVPKLGVAGGLVKLGQALLANKEESNITTQRASMAQAQMAQLAQLFGGSQGGTQAAPPPSSYAAAQSAMAQPGQGQPGPTMAAAAQIPQQSPPPQQQISGQGSAMLIPGMDPQAAMRYYIADPGKYMEALAAAKGPTTEQKNWSAQGVDPRQLASGTVLAGQRQGMTDLEKMQAARAAVPNGSPQAAQLDDAISKANYLAPIDAKPGTPMLDPRTGKPTFFAPKVADGVGLNFNDPLHPTAYALPGYADASAGIVGADQRARTGNSIQTATAPNGATVTGYGDDIFPGSAQSATRIPPAVQAARDTDRLAILQQERAKPGNTPADNAALDREIQRTGGVPATSPAIYGPGITDKESMKTGAAVIDQAPQQVAASKAAITGLTQALNLVEGGVKTGPGQAKSINALALLNNLHVPLMKKDVDGYQTLQKYLQNSLNAAAQGTSSGGSDARFESFMHGQPNAETMNPAALSSAIRYILSQHDAQLARGNFIGQAYQQAKSQGDPNPALTAQQQWSGVYNPDYFRIGRLTDSEQVKAVHAMSQTEAQHFMQWRKAMDGFQQ